MNYSKRIDDNYLKGIWKDGEILQHLDLNEIETIIKAAINANYEDIQKIIDGTYIVGSAEGVAGATLSKYAIESLTSADDKIPSALQVKEYVDAAKQEAIDAIPSNVSAFENDAQYIDKSVNNLDNYYIKDQTYTREEVQAYVKAVNDLDNYYRKDQTYTQAEVNNLVNSLIKVTIEMVDRLPSVGRENVIYFVPKNNVEESNIYDEFVYMNGEWENIGDTELDNLELDLVKDGHTATLTITKRNGTEVSVEVYDGVTPNIQIGEVETLAPGSSATVNRTGNDENPVINFGIPEGRQGFSPSARVIQDPDNFLTTIEITDENGTTSATIDLNGISQFLDSCIDELASLTTIDTTEVESLTEV